MEMNHKCSVLNPVKISEHLTILYCVVCGKEVCRWEDKIYPPKRDYYEDEKEALR